MDEYENDDLFVKHKFSYCHINPSKIIKYDTADLLDKFRVALYSTDPSKITELINSPVYYNIFSSVYSQYETDSIYSKLQQNDIKHIILTRKVSFFTNDLLDNIIIILDTLKRVKLFFSFYTHSEMIAIINYAYYDTGIMYKKSIMQYAFIHKCLIKNIILFNYMKHYLFKYNINIISHMVNILTNYNVTLINSNRINRKIALYDTKYVYNNSLRNMWILACIYTI